MHRIIGDAIGELRRLRNWSQPELAREISRHARRGTPAPEQEHISKWERGITSPASEYRIALAQLASTMARAARKERHAELAERVEDLIPIFMAGLNGWKLVSRVRLLHERRRKAIQPEGDANDKPRAGH